MIDELIEKGLTGVNLSLIEEHRRLWPELVGRCRASLLLFSRTLDPPVLDQPELVEAVRQFVLRSRFVRSRLLIQESHGLRQRGHRLLDLAQRLPSRIELRRCHPEDVDIAENFALFDDHGYLYRPLATRYEATLQLDDRLATRKLAERFDVLWERGGPDPELRRLEI